MTDTRELSITVVIAGAALALFFASANVYLGASAGTTIVSSISSGALAMLAFSRFRGNAILRANGVQTAASSGEGLAYGMLFGVPMLQDLPGVSSFEIALVVGLGGLLGVLFTIPLRRALIVERALQFPEGVATAEVLQVQPSRTSLRELVVASTVAAVAKLGARLGLWSLAAGVSGSLRNDNIRVDVGILASPGGAAVGFLIGANLALVVFAGAACSLVAGTAYVFFTAPEMLPRPQFVDPASTVDYARQVPIGALLVGGTWSLIRLRGRVTSAFAARLRSKKPVERERDLSLRIVGTLIVVVALALALFLRHWTGSLAVSLLTTLGILIIAFLLALVAGHAAGLVGVSNTPLSGLVVVGALLFAIVAISAPLNEALANAASIAVAVVACATAVAASNLQALRAGYMVGATPWKQQTMQFLGVVTAAAALPLLLGFVDTDSRLAPHLIDALRPLKFLSIRAIVIGAGIAAAVIVIDLVLQRTRRTVRVPVMAFAVGTFIPIDLAVMIAIGGAVTWWVERFLDRTNAGVDEREAVRRRGSLAAAGFIAGETIMGMLLAIPMMVAGGTNVIAVASLDNALPAIIFVLMFAILLRQLALGSGSSRRFE